MADPLEALKAVNEVYRSENIEHIISKDQAFQRMQSMNTECERLKNKLIKFKNQKETQDKQNKDAYQDMTYLRD